LIVQAPELSTEELYKNQNLFLTPLMNFKTVDPPLMFGCFEEGVKSVIPISNESQILIIATPSSKNNLIIYDTS